MMGDHNGAWRIATLGILLCACTSKADLGDVETDGADEGSTSFHTGSGDPTVAETGEDTDDETETGLDTGDNPPLPGVGPAAVDVLFVVDNSGSMAEEQAGVQNAIGTLVTALETTQLDYRIAVTTTDNGNPKCGPTGPEAGNFVSSSCRDRLGDFIFPGQDPPIDGQYACTDGCTLESIGITNGVPWIENGGSNLPEGVSVEDALRCILPLGINGCGFESQLETMRLAIQRSFTDHENEQGFIRADAHLMIVLVSDETDCSLNKEWGVIFQNDQEGGNEVFWNLPDEPSPTSGVCWNAGVTCTGGPGTYAECHPEDKDVDGNPASNPESNAVLYPLTRYQELIEDVRMSKAESHGQVFVFGILGVPLDYPSTRTVVYSDGDDATFVGDFGIGPGCDGPDGRGVPPVRMGTFIEANALTAASPMYSICGNDYAPALNAAVAQVSAFVSP
jgi:hypothetical protein